MSQVLDYSTARPVPADIVAAGYVGVVRYLAPAIDAPKVIYQPEYDALRAAGLQIALNWEWYGWRAREGASAGTADAQEALQQAEALGYTGAIYFSVDYDASEADQPAINAYFSACAEVIGLARLGAYGGYWPLSRLFDAELIRFGWQAIAWSGGNRESRAHLYQNGATALGGDVNDVLKNDWTGGNMLPDGWTDDGTTLTARNGVTLTGGFRTLLLAQPFWYGENVPNGPEYTASPLSIADPQGGNGQRMDFWYGNSFGRNQGGTDFFIPVSKEIALLKEPAPAPQPQPDPALEALEAKVKAVQALIGTIDAGLSPFLQLKNAIDQLSNGVS